MLVEDCHVCRELLDAAALRIREHLGAATRLTLAVRNTTNESEIAALEEAARAASYARTRAIIEYQQHREAHKPTSAEAYE